MENSTIQSGLNKIYTDFFKDSTKNRIKKRAFTLDILWLATKNIFLMIVQIKYIIKECIVKNIHSV